MRRTTTLTALAVMALPLGLGGVPAHAAETCDGKAATIVVTELVNSYTSAPVTGTAGDDVIVGTEQNDTIDGAGGDDTICGLGGADTLVGGEGDDRLFGGTATGYGTDTIVTGEPGRPIGVIGSAYDDVLVGTSGRASTSQTASRSRATTPCRPAHGATS